jgi:TPP-dependent indolepyruvate ferredoxin oxidoreductase alpha subunit
MKINAAQTIAQALIDLGVDIITHVPGFGGSEVFQAYNEMAMRRLPFSFHEESAFTIAHSASICGKRSSVMIKSHGFMKAANSISDSLYSEISAGFVILVFEDSSGKHSDSILEIIPILQGMSVPFFQSKIDVLYDDVINAFMESENRKMPIVLLVDSLKINEEVSFEPRQDLKKKFSYTRDVYNHVIHPMLSDYQYKVFLSRIIVGDKTLDTKPNLPTVPDDLPERAKNIALKYAPVFNIFKNYRGDIVTGDTSGTSAFAFPPYNCIDIVTYMGGSIPLAIGAYLAGFKNVWALSGDFGFISAGMIGLIEALQREIPLKIMIFYNKQAAATGGQRIDKKILRHILAGFERFIVHISNPKDPFEIENVFKEVSEINELRIIIVDYSD